MSTAAASPSSARIVPSAAGPRSSSSRPRVERGGRAVARSVPGASPIARRPALLDERPRSGGRPTLQPAQGRGARPAGDHQLRCRIADDPADPREPIANEPRAFVVDAGGSSRRGSRRAASRDRSPGASGAGGRRRDSPPARAASGAGRCRSAGPARRRDSPRPRSPRRRPSRSCWPTPAARRSRRPPAGPPRPAAAPVGSRPTRARRARRPAPRRRRARAAAPRTFGRPAGPASIRTSSAPAFPNRLARRSAFVRARGREHGRELARAGGRGRVQDLDHHGLHAATVAACPAAEVIRLGSSSSGVHRAGGERRRCEADADRRRGGAGRPARRSPPWRLPAVPDETRRRDGPARFPERGGRARGAGRPRSRGRRDRAPRGAQGDRAILRAPAAGSLGAARARPRPARVRPCAHRGRAAARGPARDGRGRSGRGGAPPRGAPSVDA